jgi:hypothetical protein
LLSDQDRGDDPATACHLLDPPHCSRAHSTLVDFES